jgi:SAM-dependent methyltransferase
MAVADVLRTLRWRAAGHFTRPLPAPFTAPLRGARVLEIGGPSRVFGIGGLVPVYPGAATVDNVQFATSTVWHDLRGDEPFAPDGTPIGTQHVMDGVDLTGLDDGVYDAVISSHVIEHTANPLRALEAWRRVTVPGGHLLIVAPHGEGTFDRRRPVTTIEHMIADHERGTGEEDLTHLEETLRLHDFARDVRQERATWEAQRRDNVATRVLHHHVFTTPSLLRLVDHAGLQLLACETRFPHDIYVLGRFAAQRPDNTAFLAIPRRSPFRGDRVR